MDRRRTLLFVTWAAVLSALVLLLASTPLARTDGAAEASQLLRQTTITRPQDPVIIPGADLPAFLDEPIGELRLYRHDGAVWTAVPFQVDEVNQEGRFVPPGGDDDDGGQALLDANDKLVFMGNDAGQVAGCIDSIELTGGSHDRTTIAVDDGLLGETGQAYLFKSTSIPTSTNSYVDWNVSTQTITGTYGSSYVAQFGVADIPILLSDLSVNGSGDIVDRQKIALRVDAEVNFGAGCVPFGCTFTEEGSNDPICGPLFDLLWGQYGPDYFDLAVVGPVRVVASLGVSAFYGSRADLGIYAPLTGLESPPVCPGSVEVVRLRTALDLNDPTGHGVDTYYDSNGSTTTIDGIPDEVPETPAVDWYQTSGGAVGGMVVAWRDVYAGTGSAFTHYLDDSGAGGTGDGSSYGEAGVEIRNTEATEIGAALTLYALPPGTSTNVGATYAAYAAEPLTAVAASETCTLYQTYLPVILTD